MLVYLNGQYLPLEEARVPVEDRGFLFADGLYEVIRVYNGRIFALEPHLRRLADGLRALRIGFTGLDQLGPIAERLLDQNGLRSGDATLYIQVTRGAAPRAHAFPSPDVPPTVYVAARPFTPYPAAYYENGVKAITVPDTRWTRCDIKTVSLVANVLANQQAKEAGAFEALFVRDGVVIEGSHSNLFAVYGDTLVTYPASNYILAGITRSIVLDIAAELGIPVRQGPILADQLFAAGELFLSGTTTEVMPVVQVDGRPIADGRPGPVTQRIQRAFRERI